MLVNYRMNAGYIAREHWVQTEEGGGRNIGEACHIYDLFNALTASMFTKISAHSIVSPSRPWLKNDNFTASISYEDGSVCSLTYTAMGAKSFPKESMEIFADGKVISLSDYKQLEVAGAKQKGWKSITQEKGQFEELRALADCLLKEKEWPIPFQQLLQATRISFDVEQQLNGELATTGVE
jgi:predicted dehydrogenase